MIRFGYVRHDMRKRRGAMTLIEVVAGLSLAGSLLTVSIVGSSQHLRQLKSSQRKMEAAKRLDNFLATWSLADFKPNGLASAANRSGLSISGDLGSHRLDRGLGATSDPQLDTRYQVRLTRAGKTGLGNASRIRLTVVATSSIGEAQQAAWAEIVVRDEY